MDKLIIGQELSNKKQKRIPPLKIVLVLIAMGLVYVVCPEFNVFFLVACNFLILVYIIYYCALYGISGSPKRPKELIMLKDDVLTYSISNDENSAFEISLKDVDKVRIDYAKGMWAGRVAFDLKLQILMKDQVLYLLNTRNIFSKAGDYEKLLSCFETYGIKIYDPYQIRPLLSLKASEFQMVLRQRLWDGELQ